MSKIIGREMTARVKTLGAIIFAFNLIACVTVQAAQRGWKWHFDVDRLGQPPVGFLLGRTGSGRMGHWVVL